MPAHQTRPVVPSESRQLRAIALTLEDVWRMKDSAAKATIALVQDQLEKMAQRAEAGLHANPGALVVYGNPGYDSYRRKDQVAVGDTIGVKVGPALGYIEQLKYERTARPQGYYFHDFGPSDALCIGTMGDGQRIVLIVNANGKPLWGEA